MRRNSGEQGNVFMFILLGVALFGALAFFISRGLRSENTTAMSERQAELLAVDVLDYGQKLARGVNRLRQKGVSENDIDFDNPDVTGYDHTPAQPATHNVFTPSGGGVPWKMPAPKTNDGSAWAFTGASCIADMGTGATGCGSDGDPNEELIAYLPNISAAVCRSIDQKLGIGAIPSDSGGGASPVKFQGVYTDGTEIITGASRDAACFERGGSYFYYVVLIAR